MFVRALTLSYNRTMSEASRPGLKRSLTFGAVVALGINGVIGQGIFLLPGHALAKIGPAAMVGLLLGAVLSFLIALCFAEVGSRFRATGGAYIYAQRAYGDFVGFEVGWMTCCVAIISWAALANGFTAVLGHFAPWIAEGWIQKASAVALMTVLMLVNLRGAKSGAAISTFFSIAKLVPLILFILVGAFYVDRALWEPVAPKGWAPLAETTMLLLYAFVGFETLVVPAGEMKNPQRAVPLALICVMLVVSVVYAAVFAVSIGTFPDIAGHKNPVAAASALIMGPVGGTLIAAGIVVSVFGTNAGAALVSPRRFFAMAERGDLPRIFARIDEATGAPRPAIVLTWALAVVLTLTGSFKELAILGVVARFGQYIPTCLAVMVLRRRSGPAEGFKVPLGPVIPLLAIGLCLWLLVNTDPMRLLWGGVAVAAGVPLYFLTPRARAERAAGGRKLSTDQAASPSKRDDG